ncbi:PREDICTED: rano class II histocompatibility antigen, D-1 beta chain-like [Cyprinodon variegatus]|uniref:rano class II histocompatibility antigen, D-1 beta chain-like n=1 Tax=Cyprinodon variegatus TaxID=28743 RepID=UPI0007429ACE|nr:PREDICTED: rano class II histocompatibility antigen, D-1 beta chain-like [Cyprinodon variegatus]
MRHYGFMEYLAIRCVFNSTELKDIQFICSEYYNKKEYLRFDSNVGRFVGYTDLGVKNAERLNKDQSQIAAFMAQRETVCQPNIDINYQVVLTKTGFGKVSAAKCSVRTLYIAVDFSEVLRDTFCSVYWRSQELHLLENYTRPAREHARFRGSEEGRLPRW